MSQKKLKQFLATSIVVALTGCATNNASMTPTPQPISAQASDHDGNAPERTLDGDIKTRWSANGDGAWVVYDYGQKVTFNAAKIAFHKGDKRSTKFDLEVSEDGQNWTKVLTDVNSTGNSLEPEVFTFKDVDAQYIKYIGHGNTSNKWNSVTEFIGLNCNVDKCTVDQAPLVPVAVTASDHDGNGPERLIDGKLKTRWSANGDGAWVMLDYGKVAEFDAVRLAFSKGDKRVTTFELEVSEDGDKWTKILGKTKSSGGVATHERFEFDPVKARFVKYVGYGNTKNKWNSVTEFSALNCAINSCPKDEIITDEIIAKAKVAATQKAAEKKIDSKRADMRSGNFGVDVPLKCDAAVSDCSKAVWWDVPLKSPKLPATPLAGNKPSQNFDLTTWYLSQPFDHDKNGKPDNVDEQYLAQGYEHPEIFYTAKDGGLVFKTYIKGVRTSKNTHHVRTEMREMLRAGDTSIPSKGVNKNNWVFGSAPIADQKAAGGVDGTMEVTLKIDHVTTTGEPNQVGRFIIGQIHDQDDEPIRLYYRKLPNRDTGSIYFAHQVHGVDEFYPLIGLMNGITDDGVALGEVFSYRIEVVGNTMTVTLIREGKPDIVQVVDMSKSGYDQGGKYMYFKVGAYNQNDSGDPDDYVQSTVYKIEKSHGKYVE